MRSYKVQFFLWTYYRHNSKILGTTIHDNFNYTSTFTKTLQQYEFSFCRYSSIKKDKPLKTSWAKKQQQRATMKALKQHANELKELRAKELEVYVVKNARKLIICINFQFSLSHM